MTAYSAIPDSDIDPESPLTASLFNRLRNNPIAALEGSSGAYKLYPGACLNPTAGNTYQVGNSLQGVTGLAVSSYTQICQHVNIGSAGVVRVWFDLAETGATTAYARIYVNGVATGTERTSTSATPTTYSEDITVAYGDVVQIYGKNGAGTANTNINNIYLTSDAPSFMWVGGYF